MDELITARLYQWKYATPFGTARIATVRDAGRLVAANAMYPLEAVHEGRRIRAWQSCDTATHPSARGQGHFMRCLHALSAELGLDEVFLGFPNANSTRGFLKLGWTAHTELRTWVRAVGPIRLGRPPALTPLKRPDSHWERLHAALSASGPAMLSRPAAYLRWRYLEHPLADYELFTSGEDDALTGLVVMRKVTLFGRPVALVMEAAATHASVERQLFRFAAAWSHSHGCRLVVAMTGWCRSRPLLLAGFLPVPARALPKRQVLMGAPHGPAAERVWAQRWRLSLGDWDVF